MDRAPALTASPPAQLVIGTAGHIDHGKSTLVRMLTGIDPDRLPEEKARGMTIDLGFAHRHVDGCDLWFVDVPGHERFIRNMVAGAAGVDLALLVVAADDGVMPQTREHAEVLRLLGVERVILAMTKTDLVDDDWAVAVEADVADALTQLGLALAGSVRTSAVANRGHDELLHLLAGEAQHRRDRPDAPRWFRLPVDRAFSVPGRGTVVTGTVAHGGVQREDELELWPPGRRVRVRDLQSHNQDRSAARGRLRLALNLAGVTLDDVGRGHVLASPGYLKPTALFEARLPVLRMPGQHTRRELRVRLHIGAAEILAVVRLPQRPAELALTDTLAQLRPAQPIVTQLGERFVIRDEAGTRTLGGGVVLRVHARPWSARNPPDPAALDRLAHGKPKDRLVEVVRGRRWPVTDPAACAAQAGLADAEEAAKLLHELCSAQRLVALSAGSTRGFIAEQVLAEVAEGVNARLSTAAAAQPRWIGVPLREWPGWMPRECPEAWRAPLADQLVAARLVLLERGYILPAGPTAGLPAEDQALLDAILREFESAGVLTPAVRELKCLSPRNAGRVTELVKLAEARGALRRIAPEIWLHDRTWQSVCERVRAHLQTAGPATVSQLRELLGTTRKYMVPLAEALDAAGVTRRQGDVRVLP